MSSLLFAIVMEALCKMISVALSGVFLSSFSMGHRDVNGIDISHLLFVNDTLIFAGLTLITSFICDACSYVLKLS